MARTATQVFVLSLLLVAGCSSSDSPTELPVTPPPPPSPTWASLGTGTGFTCGLRRTGVAFCWGRNNLGQLGNGTQTASSVPMQVTGGLQFTALAVGSFHACGLVPDGTAYCWGNGLLGALGVSLPVGGFFSPVPAPVLGGHHFTQLSTGVGTTCGVATDGITYCWGANNIGQVGDGTIRSSGMPVPAAVQNSATLGLQRVSTGSSHACAITSAGEFFCWGSARSTGNGALNDTVFAPMPAASGHVFTFQDQGFLYGCGVEATGSAFCWGHNLSGGLGNGLTSGEELTAVPVAGGLVFRMIDANIGNSAVTSTCGITTSDEAYCWGANNTGQVGAVTNETCISGGNTFNCASRPTMVSGGLGFQSVSTGQGHTCGIALDESAWCWGRNDNGQLGDGTTVGRMTPARVIEP